MKGKKIGILVVALMALSAFALPATVSAVATHTLAATPATAAWGDTEYITMVAAQNDWNGTAWCNLTDPNGDVAHLGGVACNAWAFTHTWTYIPNIPGTWTVTVEFQKATGVATMATHTTTFAQERTMVSVARETNAWGQIILYLITGLLLIALLIIMVSKVSDRTGKVK